MPNVRNVTPSNYPNAPAKYVQQYFDQFTNVLRLNLNNITNSINAPKVFGAYTSTVTQENLAAVNLLTVNTVDISYGTKIGSPASRIYVAETGIYNIQFSAQLDKTGGGPDAVWIWLRQNGVDVPHTASKVVVNGPNAEIVAAWNFVVIMQGGDYFELAWSSLDSTMHIEAFLASTVAPVHPAVPSVILTVTWVSNIPPKV